MATTISSLQSICRPNFHTISTNPSSFLPFPIEKNSKCRGMRLRIRAVDEETVAEAAAEGEVEVVASEQPVPVTVCSPCSFSISLGLSLECIVPCNKVPMFPVHSNLGMDLIALAHSASSSRRRIGR